MTIHSQIDKWHQCACRSNTYLFTIPNKSSIDSVVHAWPMTFSIYVTLHRGCYIISPKICPLRHLHVDPVSRFFPKYMIVTIDIQTDWQNDDRTRPVRIGHSIAKSLLRQATVVANFIKLTFIVVKIFRWISLNACCTAPVGSCSATAPPPRFSLFQLRHWQNKYHDIPSIAILFHDKYRGRNFQYRPTLFCCSNWT